MAFEKILKITKDEKEEVYTYYVTEKFSSEFNCIMYNVGIKSEKKHEEINDFAVSLEEAESLCNYLYRENVSPENLFLIAEEFIVTL